MLIAILLTIITIQAALSVWMIWKMTDLTEYARATHTEVMRIKRRNRTRQARAGMRNGVAPPEKKLVELGRAAKGRRVVVGGDPESPLYQALDRTPDKDENDA